MERIQNLLNNCIDKKGIIYNEWIFSRTKIIRRLKVENATGVETSKFAKKVNLPNLKSNVDKLDIEKLRNLPSNLRNLKSKVDKLDVDKLVPAPTDLSNLSDGVKKRSVTTLRLKILKIKCLILLT